MRRRLAGAGLALVLAAWGASAAGPPAKTAQRLPAIGPAPAFALTTQDGARLTLKDLRGKVVAVTFIDAGCADACPLLTAKLAALADRLGPDFGPRVRFVAITVDPERDTPEILRHHAGRHGAEGAGWAFLTGRPADIREAVRRYGIYARKTERGDVDHTCLTSLIDQRGVLRVQYLGVCFDPEEMLGDLRSLLGEAGAR